jgi:hypothetical protein
MSTASWHIFPMIITFLQKICVNTIFTRLSAEAFFKCPRHTGAIRQHGAIFRFSLTDNFDAGLSFSNI